MMARRRLTFSRLARACVLFSDLFFLARAAVPATISSLSSQSNSRPAGSAPADPAAFSPFAAVASRSTKSKPAVSHLLQNPKKSASGSDGSAGFSNAGSRTAWSTPSEASSSAGAVELNSTQTSALSSRVITKCIIPAGTSSVSGSSARSSQNQQAETSQHLCACDATGARETLRGEEGAVPSHALQEQEQ